jgi:hypothetical protein
MSYCIMDAISGINSSAVKISYLSDSNVILHPHHRVVIEKCPRVNGTRQNNSIT